MISSILRSRFRASSSPIVFMTVPSAVNLDAIVAQCFPIFEVHESQSGRAFDRTGIEQDSRDLGLPLQLIEQLRHMVEPWRYGRDSRQEHNALGRIVWC